MGDNKKVSKGHANQRSLADRMKTYEAVTTETNLIERLPIYVRIDMRAGHSFCRDLDKPFDIDYSNAMKTATAYIVEKTGAKIGYCQSDEASFYWENDTKIPFGTRLFKLQSVLASMFTASFYKACIGTKLEKKFESMLPTFDCRVMNLPNVQEVINMFIWRERDSIKNSITLLALEHFSTKQLDKKNSNEKIKMLKDIGIDYYTAIDEDLRNGAYFKREVYNKILTVDELSRIPEFQTQTMNKNENGEYVVVRSHIIQFYLSAPLNKIANKYGVLFNNEQAILL